MLILGITEKGEEKKWREKEGEEKAKEGRKKKFCGENLIHWYFELDVLLDPGITELLSNILLYPIKYFCLDSFFHEELNNQ